jgi:hypothetical protein
LFDAWIAGLALGLAAPPDLAAMATVMRRHGLTPAPPTQLSSER